MKKIIISFVGFFCLNLATCKQIDSNVNDKLFLIKKDSKYGYINNKGEIIIPCQFDSVLSFSDGLAPIYLDSLWGFIDINGKIVIPPKFKEVNRFSDGLSVVSLKSNGKSISMFINKKGEKCFETNKYEIVGHFNYGLCLVEINEKIHFMNKKGEIVIKTKFPYGFGFQDGVAVLWDDDLKVEYIDTTGRVIIPFSNFRFGENFSEGLAHASTQDNSFYIDKKGNKVIALLGGLTYNEFSDGMALVQSKQLENYTYKYGFINREGIFVIPIKYEKAYSFKEGFAAVFVNGKFGFINKKNELVIDPQFENVDIKGFNNGLCYVVKNGLKTYIDYAGNIVWQEEK